MPRLTDGDGVPVRSRLGTFNRPANLFFLPGEYATINCCVECPLHGGHPDPNCDPCGGDPPDPPVPTYFGPSGADPTDGGCATGAGGQFYTVHYQVLDQNGNPMHVSGVTPQEHITRDGSPQPGFHNYSTPETTIVDGKFDDDPVGTCFGPPKPPTNFCVSVTQDFQALYNGATYPIQTTVSRRDCNNGIRVTISGNPAAYNKTFEQGTIN